MISGVRGGTIDTEMSGSNNFTGLAPVFNPVRMSPSCFAIPRMRIKRSTAAKVGDELKITDSLKGLKSSPYWEKRLARRHQLPARR
ncbi:hypothetical protein KCP74_06570 [Salmonella enterica subsp. enterica]|nr:hypothetical protein KCP74_06570 [Salmonella enterica subsp. enterica]